METYKTFSGERKWPFPIYLSKMTSQANLILAAGLLLLLFSGVSCRPEGNSTLSSSSNSSESGQNRSLEQIISDFKLKILKSLKMVKPPNVNITYPRLPKKMIQMLLEKEKEVSKSDLKENMIVRPVNSKLLTAAHFYFLIIYSRVLVLFTEKYYKYVVCIHNFKNQ
ncbi:hypothetical protein TNCV_1828951 [Trichonephila clavipes]|nr:hypothetical protein TNCV_1828951 [Trichonephila clavipes]